MLGQKVLSDRGGGEVARSSSQLGWRLQARQGECGPIVHQELAYAL